eukprot:scaffold2376_cov188-Amphora_coffeaeformis.AAC.8
MDLPSAYFAIIGAAERTKMRRTLTVSVGAEANHTGSKIHVQDSSPGTILVCMREHDAVQCIFVNGVIVYARK